MGCVLKVCIIFSPNVISNVKWYMCSMSNIDESVMANVNLIEELIDVRNEVKWVHIFDMQNIMCIIHELCVTYRWVLFFFFTFLNFVFFLFILNCVPRCDHVRIKMIIIIIIIIS